MSTFDKIYISIKGFFNSLVESSLEFLPGILLVLLSLVVALILGFLVRLFFKAIRLNHWLERTNLMRVLHSIGIEPKTHRFIGNLVFWVSFLIMLEAVADVSGWTSISIKFGEYANLIPLLIGATIIVMVGLFLSKFIRDVVTGILAKAGSNSAKIMGNVIFYALMAMTITIALGHIGLETSIITANISVILGSFLLAFSLAFVFASRELLGNILASSYNKSNYKVGQQVSVDGKQGEIIKITNISVYLQSGGKIQVVPAKKFTDETVEILG